MKSVSNLHVVIIGGGFGGLACARRLAKQKSIKVTIIDRTNHHLFQPLLYQVATSTLTTQHISRSLRSLFAKNDQIECLYDEVITIESEAKKLVLSSGSTIHFDRLVIAAGARTAYFGNTHWADHVHELKTIDNAFHIRQGVLKNLELAERFPDQNSKEVAKLSTIVIVGGGPTGVELAGAFADLIKQNMGRNFQHFDPTQQRIILVEGQKRLLMPYDEKQSEYTRTTLEKLGVDVLLETMVKNVEEETIELSTGETIHASTIIWAAGIEAPAITRSLDTERTRSGQIIVESNLSVPQHPDIFAIGDIAAIAWKDGKYVPGIAPAAAQAGSFVGKNITLETAGKSPRSTFKYLDKGKMAIVGKGSAVVHLGPLKLGGWLGWLIWLFIHVLFLIDFRSKFSVMAAWFWAFIRNTPGNRVFITSAKEHETEIKKGASHSRQFKA